MIFPFNIGLKLYSTDVTLIQDALRLEKNTFNFIELYIIPGSYEKTINAWKSLDIPYVIHAPHSLHSVNLAQEEKWQSNLRHFNEARRFADKLVSKTIIVHGGNNGYISETIRQIRLLSEPRIALENKPKVGLQNELCIGWCPTEFYEVFNTGVLDSMVLDFAHAAYAANSLKVDEMELIRGFMAFNPKVFHLSDGDASSERDIHLNLGKGSLNLVEILPFVPQNGLLTIETPRDGNKGLKDFFNDVHFLRKLLVKQI
jgi:deoxyribonuclease-4